MNFKFSNVFSKNRIWISIIFLAFISACTSSFLKLETKEEDFKKNKEFEDKVIIKTIEPVVSEKNNLVIAENGAGKNDPAKESSESQSMTKTTKKDDSSSADKKSKDKNKDNKTDSKTENKKNKKIKTSKENPKNKETKALPENGTDGIIISGNHLPDIEDSEGFEGRRPIVDPFRVGEEVVHDVHYFKVSAGELKLKVEPFAEVNGRKSYAFATEVKSASMFSSFYSVDDRAVTYVDFLEFVPHVFTLAVKESGQIRDGKGLFDIQKNMATYWEKKFTKKNGQEEKKLEWEILPYSQNVYSAAYYMRLFKWTVGKEYAFRVADNGENIVFKGKAIRKEKLSTDVGDFDTIVIKPEISVKGIFRPIGDIFFWLSDDDRKFVLRIESNIKIGTIVSEVVKLKKE